MEIILKSFTEITIFFIGVIIIEFCVKYSELKREMKNEANILGNDVSSQKIRTRYKRRKILKWSIIAGTSIAILITAATSIKVYFSL